LTHSIRKGTITPALLYRDTIMPMKTRFSVVVILSLTVTSLVAQESTPASSTKHAITEKDLFGFIWVADPQLSPDGSRVAFTRVNVDEKRTSYETSIWTVDT